jgi:uncharacterized membrane protein YbhN (UPF0104 family)
VTLAIAITGINYVFLTGYDTLAVQFVNHPLPYKKTALVAILSYAISNSIGFALLSGSMIRYRFYNRWGFSTLEIAKIIVFCNMSFWLGLFWVGGILFSSESLVIPAVFKLPFHSIRVLGCIFLAMVFGYFIWSLISHHSLRIKNFVLPRIPIQLSLAQIVVTTLDWACASGILYILLPGNHLFSYPTFFGMYLLAQITGILSNVPGGLGVFESVLLFLLSPQLDSAEVLGCLFAYRGIYYFLPFAIAMITFIIYEIRTRIKDYKKRSRTNDTPS